MKRCLQHPTVHSLSIGTTLAALLLVRAATVTGAPTISFPINSQVPPVARVSKPFRFTFSSSTFSSNLGILQYSIRDAPAWLQLDGGSRTLWGTPDAKDVGAADIHLVAQDQAGLTSMPVTLIVSSESGPELGTPVSQQLSILDSFSYPDGLLIYPSSPLSVTFRPNTFTNTDEKTVYYAVCANNTPLPSWIKFDVKSLSLSGTTPAFTSPWELPQEFGIQITASDVVGFAGAVATFRLVVESHKLAFHNPIAAVNVTPGDQVKIVGIRQALSLDSRPIRDAELKQVLSDTPDWLSLDTTSLVLSGTAPTDVASQSIGLSIFDQYGDNANTTIALVVGTSSKSSGLIPGAVGELKATIGSWFSYTFDRSIFANSAIQVNLDLGNTSSWLSFNTATLLLQGHVPTALEPQRITLQITAKDGSKSESQAITLSVESAGTGAGSSSTVSETPPGSSLTANPEPSLQPGPSINGNAEASRQTLAAKIVLPVIAVLGLLLIIYCCRRRSKKRLSREGYLGSVRRQGRPSSEESQYSRSQLQMLERPPLIGHRRLPSKAPEIEIPDSLRVSRAKRRRSRVGSPQQQAVHHNARLSKHESWQSYVQRLTNQGIVPNPAKRQSMAVPDFVNMTEENAPLRGRDASYASRERPYLCKRPSRIMALPSERYSLQPTLDSSWTSGSSSLSNHRLSNRMSGLGHGRGYIDASPWQRHSRHRNRRSGRVSKYGIGHGKAAFTREVSDTPGFRITQTSWPTISENSRTTMTETIGSKQSFGSSMLGSKKGSHLSRIPTLDSITPECISHDVKNASESYGRPTIRPVTSPSRPVSPTKFHNDVSPRRREYYKSRRRHGESVLFSAKPSSRILSQSDRVKAVVSPSLECSTEDNIDEGSNKENSINIVLKPLLREPSRESSAQRKGRMMQRNYSASSYIHAPSVPQPLTHRKSKPTSLSPTKASTRKNKALGISRYQSSKSSLASSRFQSANESEIASVIETGDLLEEQEGESDGERKWARAMPNPLGMHGTEGTKLQRIAWVRGDRGSVSGEGSQDEGGRIVLGGRGTRPVSVENEMDVTRGGPGSRSMTIQKAYI